MERQTPDGTSFKRAGSTGAPSVAVTSDLCGKVLIVDDEPHVVELLTSYLERMGHETYGLSDPRRMESVLESVDPSVCILDFSMPHLNGLAVMDVVRESGPSRQVIFLTAEDDTGLAIDALKRGARDYLRKPVKLLDVERAVIEALEQRRSAMEHDAYLVGLQELVARRTAALDRAVGAREPVSLSTLEALASALDLRDQSTGGHSKRVANLTAGVAETMGIAGPELEQIRYGALLHDIGKLKIPDRILLKPGELTGEEWHIMRRHPEYGFDFVKRLPSLEGAAAMVHAHHEKFNGSGYPAGLAGESIPIGARIFAIVDAVDAMIFDRPYRKAIRFDEAEAEVRRCSGSHFDPDLVELALGYLKRSLG
jgi:putative nucleotidyltransferase with HDIG domain